MGFEMGLKKPKGGITLDKSDAKTGDGAYAFEFGEQKKSDRIKFEK